MCICVCICANNMQILGFGGVGEVRSGGGIPLGGEGGGCGGPGTGLIYIDKCTDIEDDSLSQFAVSYIHMDIS